VSRNKELVFLCGARDYHAMDWYHRAVESLGYPLVSIMTDLIESEGFPKLINSLDRVHKMIVIDPILFSSQSKRGNIWRNLVKFMLIPLQVRYIRSYAKYNENTIFYAHSMYYVWLAYFARVGFVGRPQGSDILVKPFLSKIYFYLTVRSLVAAKHIIVDSVDMKNTIDHITDNDCRVAVVMNGIDLKSINYVRERTPQDNSRKGILSSRGMTSLYRIDNIVQSRNNSKYSREINISFIYPYYEESYRCNILDSLTAFDSDIGKLKKKDYYQVLFNSMLVISIPKSDSSPRSVFEAIFCGCAVAITYNKYYEYLTPCMQNRVIIVNLSDDGWFDEAVNKAKMITESAFVPTEESLKLFDQNRTFEKMRKYLGN